MKQILGALGILTLTFGVSRYALTANSKPETVYFFTQGRWAEVDNEAALRAIAEIPGIEQVTLHDEGRAFKVTFQPASRGHRAVRSFFQCMGLHAQAMGQCAERSTALAVAAVHAE